MMICLSVPGFEEIAHTALQVVKGNWVELEARLRARTCLRTETRVMATEVGMRDKGALS